MRPARPVWAALLAMLACACGATSSPVPGPGPSDGVSAFSIPCEPAEQVATHYHAHLAIIDSGRSVVVAAGIGIKSGCIYWLHTHDASGIIHIEAPAAERNRVFTLGQLFAVWGRPLSARQIGEQKVGVGQQLRPFVDGQAFIGDPSLIPLARHSVITLEIAPPEVAPLDFRFPPNY